MGSTVESWITPAQTATAYTSITDVFTAAQDYADDAFDTVSAAIVTLGEELTAIDLTRPTLDVISVDQSFVVDPVIEQARTTIEDLTGDLAATITDPGDSPDIATYAIPTEPAFSWPTEPTLSDITIPTFIPELTWELSTTLPSFDVAPPDLQNTIEDALTGASATPLMSDLGLAVSVHDKLKSNIDSGGTMLDATVEADIWNRDLERHEQALQDIVDKATGQWAKFGFSLPDGLLAGQLLAINNEYVNKRLDRSREISIKQAELEQAGMMRSLELGTGFTSMWFNVLEAYKRRVFDITHLTVNTVMAIYNARVNQYNIQLETFKADLAAWKTGIEREMLRAETYKAEIAGKALVAQIDEVKLKTYMAQLNAVEQLISVWNNEIKAVVVQYEAEKTKIEAYKSKVDAYVARVDAATKKYASSMSGVDTLIKGWTASADAKIRLIDLKAKADMFEIDTVLKEWDVELKQKEQNLTLKIEGLKTSAQVASNVAAGALSAAHVNMSQATSASASQSVSTSEIYSY